MHAEQRPYSPACVRVDRTGDSVYVVSDKLYKYDKDGKQLFAASIGDNRGWGIAIDAARNVWVATRADIRELSHEGRSLLRVDEFPNINKKYIAFPPARR